MSNFKPSNFLQECIEKRDVEGIKNILYMSLNTDRSFSTGNFDNILNYAKERVPEFISSDKGETFKSECTESYWSELAVSLRNEFTMEKVRQLKKMSEELYPPRTSSYKNTDGSTESPKISPIAIAVGAVVVIGIIIAIAAGK
ncbi:hypothetical protein Q5M87_05460 [Brachyspira innocens]|uniref:Uncharacterized protein n=1 Tax=Brachyspira innocens TaxID=13264 RepID=A0ABT8YU18_9SPIR|nr:hypothetical protein [Brachyspira innocens]MDO6993455.1 hypothetical protein [Brachyspira innocens]MDO7019316.1 hypothetical protein [Brachyspira innocens]